MTKPIDCVITTLVPVHLGADEVYEPLGFVIDEDNHCLVAFEPWSFLEKLPERDRQEFARLCHKGTVTSLLEIYRFFRERRRLAQGRLVGVCPGLVKHYQGVLQSIGRDLEIKKALNQFTIHRTAFLAADQRPYIPGSAIKGALRTAYLNSLAQQKPHIKSNPKEKGAAAKLERNLLDGGSFHTDPFRLLKVSDFLPVGEVQTQIVYAVNEKKKTSQFQARGPYQILEVIEPGSQFTGAITVESLPGDVRKKAGIERFLERDGLWSSANAFYRKEKEREDQELFELGFKAAPLEVPADGFPLRLGRHSGAECVTIEGHRNIRIMQARGQPPKFLNQATTLWLTADFHQREKRQAANLRPMGWAALGELTEESLQKLASQEEIWRKQVKEGLATIPVSEATEVPPGKEVPPAPEEAPAREVWDQAVLTWDPGSQTLTATLQNRKAYLKGKDQVKELLPGPLQKRLLDKKKTTPARVTVDPQTFLVVAIED